MNEPTQTHETPPAVGLGSSELFGEVSRLKKELADEKADHADTQTKWNEALDKGLSLLADIEKLRDEQMRLTGLLRLEELACKAERRACEALEHDNRALSDEIVKLTEELLAAHTPSSPNTQAEPRAQRE